MNPPRSTIATLLPRCFAFLFASAVLLLGLAPAAALAQVSVLGTPATATETSGNQFSKTMAFTVPAGNNRLLVVTTGGSANAATVTSVTFGGTPLTQGVTTAVGTTRSSIFFLVLGNSGTANTANVIVNYSSTFLFDVTAIAFQGVDQTTPVSGAVSGNDQTLAVVSAANDFVIDAIVGFGSGVAVGAGQTLRANNNNLVFGTGPPHAGTSTKPGAASVAMDWTGFISGIAHVALNVRQVPAAVSITTASLPNAVQNVAGYSQAIAATGGTGAKTFAVLSGSLPTGLTINLAGTISGTPTTAGTFNFTISAVDTVGVIGSKAFTITVTAAVTPITLTPATLPNTSVNTFYSQALTATGGTGAKTLAVTTGTLPTGLTLSSAGALIGTPTAAGTFNFTVTATDTVSATGAQAYTIVVSAAATPLAIATTTLPNPVLNVAGYSQVVATTGGTGTTTFNIIDGTLPPGLTITLAGTIRGTATTAGTFTFTVAAIDTAATVVSRAFTLVVAAAAPITITPTTLPNTNVGGSLYAPFLTATGGTGPYTFAVTAGALPSSLAFTTGGIFSGFPTPAGTYNFTITVTDSLGATGSRAYSIVVGAALPAQTITFAPLANRVVGEGPFQLTATATSGLPVTFFTFGPAAQINGTILTLSGVPGTVSVTASQSGNASFAAATSVTQSFTVTARTDRIINLSSRVRIAPDAGRSLITGFVIGGTQSKRVLLRAIGPALTGFGVTGALVNPSLQVFDATGRVILTNDDWSGTDTAAAFTQVQAFGLTVGSRDAALLATLAPGAYTMQVTAGNETGIALAEIYDASPTANTDPQRLINIASRGTVEPGDGVLIAGFVISGNTSKKVLVRGIGPGLNQFGLTGTVPDPSVAVFAGSTVIAQNDDWSVPLPVAGGQTPATVAELAATAQTVSAFALTTGAKDAALLVTLAPGVYTAQVSGAGTSTGVGLVEIYEVP